MFESLFELLFKYRPLVFRQGEFTLGWPWPVSVAVLALAAAGAVTLLSYARVTGRSRRIDRAVLAGLRLAAVGVVLFCLFRPMLVLSSVVPQQNFLGVLIDDSRSMAIADRDEEPRSAFVARQFGTEQSPLFAALADRFALRFFRFASTTERLDRIGSLSFAGTRTDLGQALDRARDELAGVPLSGLVVVTDGADNSGAGLTGPLRALAAESVPVYTVGLGRETFARDIQLSRVDTPRSVLKGTSVVVDVVVGQVGYDGAAVTLQVEDAGRIVASQPVELPSNGDPASVRIHFTAAEPGPRIFRFRVPPQPGEMVAQNNARDALILVEDRKEKILYFEGEPRFEVKFIRRAVADDENLQVVVLQRTAENKYLRLDVDDADDLVGGFPRTREELFRYRGLILGSVEASYFTPDQLRMIADFVNQRGGGFLMLGGRHAFAEGGYAGTPVADVLPVILETPAGEGDDPVFTELRVEPTRAGATHPATQIAGTEQASAARWATLPAVSTLNPIHRTKPGATALLAGKSDQGEGDQVVLAYQRYGAGKTIAFSIQDSWLWQMHADIAPDDMTHERLWRRLLRWLVEGVPDRVVTSLRRDRVEPGEPVELLTDVVDPAYLEMNNSRVVAHVTGPSGTVVQVPLDWTTERDGEYGGRITPREEGLYEIRVEASRNGVAIGSDIDYVLAAASESEYFDSAMRAPLLRRIADETGGRFYTPATVTSLPEDIRYTGSGATVVEELDLWDMPLLLVLLVALIGGEWAYRRARGLA